MAGRIISILLILTVLSIYAESKYAFVDIDRVFSEYKGINDINTQIDKEMRDWKDQMTTMEKDINALEKDFAEEAPMLSEEAKVRKRDEINKKRKQLDLFIEEIWGENGKAANINLQLLKPVAEKINAVISEMAVQGKYAGIFLKVMCSMLTRNWISLRLLLMSLIRSFLYLCRH